MRSKAAWIVATVTAAVMMLAGPAPAGADPFGLDQPDNNVSGVGAIPDNFNHTYCFLGSGWTAAWMNLVHTQMANLDTQTAYFDTFPVPTGCFETTDLWFELADLGTNTRGQWSCRIWTDRFGGPPPHNCEGATIQINNRTGVLTDDHQRRKTICHEIGHSVGLAHGTNTATFWNDCMFSGAVPAGIQWERYNAHHVAHADSRTRSSS